MTDLEFLHFKRLKDAIQARYLENHTPSEENISKWKGIDIIYFQEDLRKFAKGNISEKSFYTYFKAEPLLKLPRIDMLNLLSIYAGYESWYDFKKKQEILLDLPKKEADNSIDISIISTNIKENDKLSISEDIKQEKTEFLEDKSTDLQKSTTDNQSNKEIKPILKEAEISSVKSNSKKIKDAIWLVISFVLMIAVGLLAFKDSIFGRHYTYCFTDADRNSEIRGELEITVFKENESPLFYRIKPGECFYYSTKEKNLKMEISSTLYENLTITRNLENAQENEKIELKPDDYKMAVDYFSKKGIGANLDDDITKKRNQLNRLIADDAIIYQIFDSDIYGIETLNKQKYITLVTTPTTALKNLKVIEMKREKGKIISIKFKISDNETK